MATDCTTLGTEYKGETVLSVQCLTLRDAVGLSVGTESAMLSFVAVAIILLLICYKVWCKTLFPPTPAAKQHLIQFPADLFMLSLFIADLLQAAGGAMNVKWVHDERVSSGNYCIAQGVIEQLGEATVAIVTLVIAMHTFSSVWWGKGIKSLVTASIIMAIVWLFVILFVAIGLGLNFHKNYMTPTYWCWIGPNYLAEKIAGEYVWFWLTLCFSVAFYVPLFFWSRGNITVDQQKWWKFSVHKSKNSHEESDRRRHSIKLIAYPIIYSILVIPTSVVRFIEFGQEGAHKVQHVPTAWVFFAESVYRLGGILNVLLFLLTRRGLLLFGDDTPIAKPFIDSKDSLNGGVADGMRDDMQMGRLPEEEATAWELPQNEE